MTLEYLKDGPAGDLIVSGLENVKVGVDEDGDPITSCVVQETQTAGKVDLKVRGAAKRALDALYDALLDLGEMVEAGPIPSNTRTISIVRWREYCEAKTIADSDDPDSERKAFVRASKKLQDLQIIGVWNDRVWVAGQAGQGRT
jgi:hypothetical protein